MTTTTTELLNDRIAGVPAIQPARAYSLAEVEQMARHAAASRMYGMDQAQAFTLMMLCYSDGLDPIQAVRRYHVIQGRPSMRADAMLAEFQRQGGTVEWIRTDDRGCEAIFRHPRHAPKGQRVTFTLEDATRAELSGKDNWRHYPRQMCRARVVSEGIRLVLPGIVVGIYTPEEMADSAWTPDREGPRASRGDSPRPATVHEPVHEPGEPSRSAPSPEPSDLRKRVRAELKAAHDELRNALLLAGKFDPDRKPEPFANEFQIVNALITEWVIAGLIDEDTILTDGKRDRRRAAAAVLDLHRRMPAAVEEDVKAEVAERLAAALKAWGLGPDADESQAAADEDGASP